MSIQERLDLEFIAPRLLEIFNENKEPGDNYNVSIEHDLIEHDKYTVIIYNNGIDCITIEQPEFIGGKYVLTIGYVNKCNDQKSGTTNLRNFVMFGLKYEYDTINLVNIAVIPITINDREPKDVAAGTINIDLTKFKLLTIGNSWYSQFGFEYTDADKNINTIDNQTKLQEFITSPFSFLIDKFNDYVDEYVDSGAISEFRSNDIKINFLNDIKAYIFRLNEYFHLGIDLGIDGELGLNLRIDDTFNLLLRNIMAIYSIINNSESLREKTDFRVEVIRFTSFMDYILSSIIKLLFTKFTSNVLTKFTNEYRFLKLDLTTLQFNSKISGGKSIKRKSIKRKSTRNMRKTKKYRKTRN